MTTVRQDERSAVLTLIQLIHQNVEAPVSARRAAEAIIDLADERRCEFIAAMCARVRTEAGEEIGRRMERAGWPDAAWVARGYAQEVARR